MKSIAHPAGKWLLAIVITIYPFHLATGEIIYVDASATGANNGSSWTDAYNYLKDALSYALSGDSIWVAQGTYKPDRDTSHPGGSGSRTATFQLKNGVALYGGFPTGGGLWESRDPNAYTTILSGDIGVADNNSDNSYHVVDGSVTNSTAILDGFTITKGYAYGSGADNGGGMYNYSGSPTLANCTFTGNEVDSTGGGMYNSKSSPTVTNCTFSGNSASNSGGGMHNYSNSSPTLTNCTFSGNLVASVGGGMYNSYSSEPTLTNCTFIGNSAVIYGGGMYNDNCSLVVTNCTFSGNSATTGSGGGMYNVNYSYSNITNCTFSGNEADNMGGGIYNVYYSYSNITNCTFTGNSADYGGGMYNDPHSDTTLTNCTFIGNSANFRGGGIRNESGSLTINNCILWGNTAPTEPQIFGAATVSSSDVQGGWEGTGNISADPLFVDADDNLRLSFGSPCIDAADNNSVPSGIVTDLDGLPRFFDDPRTVDTGNGTPPIVDMGAYEYEYQPFVYVDANATGANNGSNWANAYKYLQNALTVSEPNDAIWVAQGTYRPDKDTAHPGGTGSRTATFQLKNNVALYGGFPAGGGTWESRNPGTYVTILSGDINVPDNNSDNSYHVVTGSDTNSTAILDGFTITKGKANGSIVSQKEGGGMYNNSGSPTVTNCKFTANSATAYGSGMSNNNSSSPILINCIFNSNTGGGGGMANRLGSNPTIANCIFSGNSNYSGGGMYNYYSDPNLTNCTFSGNEGGGMENDYSSPTLINCIFTGNSTESYGGGMSNWADSVEGSIPIITNCVFYSNTAYMGGGVYNEFSSPVLTNCILWGNNASYGPQIDGNPATVSFSDVQGGYSGTGNINADPLFVDAPDNLRLSPGSPCIDAADNSAVPAGIETDLDGRDRFADGDCDTTVIVDMGAFEFTHAYFGDFDSDCDVDFIDFTILANYWLTDELLTDIAPTPAGDGLVDTSDLAVLCDNWLADF